MNGILLIDKPYGLSSNKALQKVRHCFNRCKAGHTGSLDPLATGMLPICLGEATKFSQYFLDADKTYLATAQFGIVTTTADAEGEIIEKSDCAKLTRSSIQSCLAGFRGDIEQIPPIYSALKHKGQPLYKLARAGKSIPIISRQVSIHQLDLQSFDPSNFTATFYIKCSKGTYIRSLIKDIGQRLGVGAYVKKLHRSTVSPFHQQQIISLSSLETMLEIERTQLVISLNNIPWPIPKVSITANQLECLIQGKTIDVDTQTDNILAIYFERWFVGTGHSTRGTLTIKRMMSNHHLTQLLTAQLA